MITRVVNGQPVNINTDFWAKPIPTNKFDWSAVTDNYDCDCDEDGYYSTDPIGYGSTEEEAVADLINQLEDAA